jgi:arylsulfatase A-like enzyme
MKRRDFLKTAGGVAAGLAVECDTQGGPAGAKRPNLLIVFPDQMRGQALGFLGEDPVITPYLDAFAGESLVLPQAVSNYPVCSPYRAMLMAGTYPHANRVLSNCNSNTTPYDCELQEGDRCWSDVLKDKGYSLGYIGKWHLDSPRKPYVESYNNRPEFAWNEWCAPHRRHGFDFWYSYGTFDRHLAPEYWSTDMTRDERVKVKQWGPEHEADLAVKYIRNEGGAYRKNDRPFALVVSMNPPHTPYPAVPERYVKRYGDKTWRELINRPNVAVDGDSRPAREAKAQIKNYFAMVTGVDEQFGRILAALKEQGLDDDTIVLFTSDHGNCLGCHDQPTKNVHYEESMRVPFLVRWPGRIKARRDNLLLSSPDICPTLLDLMGFGSDIPPGVQGVSHAALFRGEKGPRPRSQLYIWVPPGKPAWGRRGVRTERYTLVISRMPEKPDEWILHDNVDDPYQLRNIAAGKREVVKTLVDKELVPWLEKTGDPWQVPALG